MSKLGCVVSGKLAPGTKVDVVAPMTTRATTLARHATVAAIAAVEIVLREYPESAYADALITATANLHSARDAIKVGSCSGLMDAYEGAITRANRLVRSLAEGIGWDVNTVRPGAVFASIAAQDPARRESARSWAALQATVHAFAAVATILSRPDVIVMVPSVRNLYGDAVRLAVWLGWTVPRDWYETTVTDNVTSGVVPPNKETDDVQIRERPPERG